ncbi:RNA polymerase sigma factor [Winogradskya consettensis]|uniref:DNA-directed RNA polymerase sigma-70 factor n=1 Tax=Winogradskya consettensis TaxID=113560 RepID=A0A919SLK0_9ACTN|nr:RNA polymerase sigma factor [Actinoplanes consettensis]GIM74270.1 DNA-directed RNA polymerase sigma-70 factor [Actinoplanes consettensis]
MTALDARHVTSDPDVAALLASLTDPDLFAVLFDRYFAELRHYAASRLGGERGDDVAAETFLVAFRTRGRFRTDVPGGGNVRAWLYGIATNLIHRQRRDEERRYRALARASAVIDRGVPVSSGDDATVARVAAGALQPALARALAALPARDRDVLLLTAVAQLDYAEVSAALGVPPGTVGSRLTRARRAVREAFGGTDPTRIDEGTP